MKGLLEKLKGKRTYLTALVAGLLTAAQFLGYEIPEWIWPLLGAFGLGFLRAAIPVKR